VGGGEVRLHVDRVFGPEIGALVVFVAEVELCDVEIFVYALVIGLNSFDLWELAMDGGAFGRIAAGGRVFGRVVTGRRVGVVGGTGTAAAGVVTGEFGRGLSGEWMLGGRVGGSGGRSRRVWRIWRGTC